MSIIAVDVHHFIHTCPADPEPHPVHTSREIVHITPARPCQHPITLRFANETTVLDCGRALPRDRQCPACRTVVTTHTVTTTDFGYEGPEHRAPAHEETP